MNIDKTDLEKAQRESTGASTTQIRNSPKQALADFATRVLDQVRAAGPLPLRPPMQIQVATADLPKAPFGGPGATQNPTAGGTSAVQPPTSVHRFDVFESGSLVQYDIPATLV